MLPGASFFEDVPLVEFLYLVFTRTLDGVTVGDSGLCCCVPCLSSAINSLCLGSPRAHLHLAGMLQFMSDINQPSLPTLFYSVLVSVSVFMVLSTLFHSINTLNDSPFSHSVLRVLSLPYWFFQLHIFS